jgi:hypothetical protein
MEVEGEREGGKWQNSPENSHAPLRTINSFQIQKPVVNK